MQCEIMGDLVEVLFFYSQKLYFALFVLVFI